MDSEELRIWLFVGAVVLVYLVARGNMEFTVAVIVGVAVGGVLLGVVYWLVNLHDDRVLRRAGLK